jgi:hypothetical protein
MDGRRPARAGHRTRLTGRLVQHITLTCGNVVRDPLLSGGQANHESTLAPRLGPFVGSPPRGAADGASWGVCVGRDVHDRRPDQPASLQVEPVAQMAAGQVRGRHWPLKVREVREGETGRTRRFADRQAFAARSRPRRFDSSRDACQSRTRCVIVSSSCQRRALPQRWGGSPAPPPRSGPPTGPKAPMRSFALTT